MFYKNDKIKIRKKNAIIPLMLEPSSYEFEPEITFQAESRELILDENEDEFNYIFGLVIWREGYKITIEYDDGTQEFGDIDDLVAFRGLKHYENC